MAKIVVFDAFGDQRVSSFGNPKRQERMFAQKAHGRRFPWPSVGMFRDKPAL
jgi:hypothetical protein